MKRKTTSFIDGTANNHKMSRAGAAYVLRHWRSLGLTIGFYWAGNMKGYYIGDRLGCAPGYNATVFI